MTQMIGGVGGAQNSTAAWVGQVEKDIAVRDGRRHVRDDPLMSNWEEQLSKKGKNLNFHQFQN